MTGSLVERAAEAKSDRLVAYLLDFGLLSAGAFGLWIVSFVANTAITVGTMSAASATDPSSPFAGGSALAGTLVGFAVSALLWLAIGGLLVWYFVYYADDGQTVGKRSQDVAVVDADGDVPSMRQRLIRTAVLLAPFPFMAVLGTLLSFVGFVFALFLMIGWLVVEALALFLSDDARRIGDHLAGTYVVTVAE